MSSEQYKVGMSVVSPKAPQWGMGKIIAVYERTIIVRFHSGGTRELDSVGAPLEIVGDREVATRHSGTYWSEIEAAVDYFAKPDRIFSLKDLQEKGLPPPCSGVYGWYLDEPPPYVPKSGCTPIRKGWVFREKWWLLYVGQAKNLRDRIVHYHIKGRHYAEGTMSSLRLSLGCLLSKKYGLILYYPPESFGRKERKLNNWLEKHTRVAWIETVNIDAVERKAIKRYKLPLNHTHNDHPLVKPLSDLRTAFKNIAIDPVRKSKTKYFRRAYKEFVKQCEDKEYVRRCKELGVKK